MKIRTVQIPKEIDIIEFQKVVGFISEEIIEYRLLNNELIIQMLDSADEEKIISSLLVQANKFISARQIEVKIFENYLEKQYYDSRAEKEIIYFGDGVIGLNEKAIFIFRYFENIFAGYAKEVNAIEKIYPVLLPIESYKKTNYLKTSPQYSMFCCSACENIENLVKVDDYVGTDKMNGFINNPQFALSPSACFHVYDDYKNQVLNNNSVFTFTQRVFRNEGRFNYSELGRLRDYHVREIVIVGSQDYVTQMRNMFLEKTIEFMKSINLCGNISIAADPFIIPKMQKYKKMQILDASKYEMKLNYETDKFMSVASFNLHGTAFTYPFNIRIKNYDDTVTGCIGYGLERWTISFISQYGYNVDNWPKKMKEVFYSEKY